MTFWSIFVAEPSFFSGQPLTGTEGQFPKKPRQAPFSTCGSSPALHPIPYCKLLQPRDWASLPPASLPYVNQPFWPLLCIGSTHGLLVFCSSHDLLALSLSFIPLSCHSCPPTWTGSVWNLPYASGCLFPHVYNENPQSYFGAVMSSFPHFIRCPDYRGEYVSLLPIDSASEQSWFDSPKVCTDYLFLLASAINQIWTKF